MAFSKSIVAKRMVSVDADFTAQLEAQPSTGKRDLFEFKGDKYGTVRVRAYLPEGVNIKAIKGHVLDFSAVDSKGNSTTLAEEPDDNTRRNEIVGRVVIMLDSNGKPSGYGNMSDDGFEDTILVVVNLPSYAKVNSITLAV